MRLLSIILLLLCSTYTISQAAEELTANDFAYGYTLLVPENGAVYSLPLPDELYRKIRRADLGDIRVFNGAGEQVPHALRGLEIADDTVAVSQNVPFFPLYEDDIRQTDNVTLSVRRNTDGTLIDIDSKSGSFGGEREPSSYLLDLGELHRQLGTLEISWQVDPAHTSSSVMVQQSADLQNWWPLVQKTTLIDLQYEGNRVEQRKILLPAAPERYLKIVWLKASSSLKLTHVTGVSKSQSYQQLQWVVLSDGEKGKFGDSATIDFSSPYRLPVRSIKVGFPEQNSIINGSVQSRMTMDDEWRQRCQNVFYSLNMAGEQLQSEPCSFTPTGDRQWRLVVLEDGAGLKDSERTVTLELGWQSGEIVFLARGTGPFILAYGSGKLENVVPPGRTDMILQAVKQQQAGTILQQAKLGKALELGGEKALIPPPPPKPWKTWLLWVVLIAGMVVMGYMVRNLVKDMADKKEGGEERREPE